LEQEADQAPAAAAPRTQPTVRPVTVAGGLPAMSKKAASPAASRAPAPAASPAAEERRRSAPGGPTQSRTEPGPPATPAPQGPPEPAGGWLDYDGLTLAGPGAPGRGRLQRAGDDPGASARSAACAQLERLSPAGHSDPRDGRGQFDHAFAVRGAGEVPADGLPHRVSLGEARVAPALRLRCVPLEDPKVFREATLQNPFEAPLLAGPVEVTVDGQRLGVTPMQRTDRGGSLAVGLGVEERLRVSRNVRAEEASAGLLGGSTAIAHQVEIELASALGREVEVEVLDRVPVSDERQVEIERLPADPPPEEYRQPEGAQALRGGLLFRVRVAPGGKARAGHGYRVLIPSRDELVGGNRRG
jgi:hypothetical protein